jgi:hypothetical protein
MFPGGASVLMDALLQLIKLVGPHTGYFSTLNAAGARNWFDDPYAYDQVASGIGSLVEKLRPPGPTAFPQELEKDADVQKYFGRDVAREFLEILVHEGGGGANDDEITHRVATGEGRVGDGQRPHTYPRSQHMGAEVRCRYRASA